MSQVRINLQPPPNVDFVTGYPGIPPGPDRPQAAVKGAIEVRVANAGVKAKWVRIELRKVETLPGGGQGNTFHDFVGPSPVNLWNTADEYSILRSQDFPFSIRIPESIPPTIALDNRAGISYELVASICTKGKKGFLRKAKSVVVSSVAPIIIDKHELHSTWPVYCQPESRHITQEGITLIIDRSRTCYGPGDRISLVATVKSDSLQPVVLRGFEVSLREATVFRAGPQAPGKKNAPQAIQKNIAENKFAVNSTLYGGTSHTADLSCILSEHHTTTTLNAARHIDVTYTLSVKAVLTTGAHLVMDLPVIISNWQRPVSQEAMSRIGTAPGLSLTSTSPVSSPTTGVNRLGRPAEAVAATLPSNYGRSPTTSYAALPPGAAASATVAGFGRAAPLADEFGVTRTVPAVSSTTLPASTPGRSQSATTTTTTVSPRRPGSSGSPPSHRLTIVNAQPNEIPQEPVIQERTPGPANTPWLSAEQEKLKLYEKARLQVAKTQGGNAAPPPASTTPPPSESFTSSPARNPASQSPKQTQNTAWLSAEEEKLQLFQKAQAAAAKTHGSQPFNPALARSDPEPAKSQATFGGGSKPSGAQLYASAIHAQSHHRNNSNTASGSAGGSSAAAAAASKPNARSPVPYLTAEQEKAALRRYEDAKRAVDKTQYTSFGDETHPPLSNANAPAGPISYESLYPGAKPVASSSPPPPVAADAPPPFDPPATMNAFAQLSEKERLRRAYEAQDAAALARQPQNSSPAPPAPYTAPPPLGPPTPGQYTNALEEKEALRRKFEARDNAQLQRNLSSPQTPPSRTNASKNENFSVSPARSPSSPGFRPTPVPPATAGSGSSKILTAAEEKALLRAKMEARDAGRRPSPASVTTNGGSSVTTNGNAYTPSTPPPLMPRPPVEYIKETQEEDARVSRLNGEVPVLDDGSASQPAKPPPGGGLDMKPFTPFRAAFDSHGAGPIPPLPPKPAGE